MYKTDRLFATVSFPNVFHKFFSLVSGNGDKPEKPHFDSRSLIFELDPCNGNGKVCLVYKHAEPGKTEKRKVSYLLLWIVSEGHMWKVIVYF